MLFFPKVLWMACGVTGDHGHVVSPVVEGQKAGLNCVTILLQPMEAWIVWVIPTVITLRMKLVLFVTLLDVGK